MYKLEISNKKGEKRVVDCTDEKEIDSALKKLGENSLLQRLKIGENKNGATLRIVSDNDFDEAVTKILTRNSDTLYDAVCLAKKLREVKDETIKEEIERNALNGQYETKEGLCEDIRKMKIEFSSAREDFYCPLHATLMDYLGNESKVSQEMLTGYEEAIQQKMEDEQTVEGEMTGYLGRGAEIYEKLNYAEWGVEMRGERLYGKSDTTCRKTGRVRVLSGNERRRNARANAERTGILRYTRLNG